MLCKENQWLAKTRKLQFVTPIWQRPSKCLTSKNMMFTTCSTFLCALDLQETNINILLRLVTWPAAAFNQIVWWSSVLTTLCELSSIGTRLTRFFNSKAFLWQKFEIIMVASSRVFIFAVSREYITYIFQKWFRLWSFDANEHCIIDITQMQ